MLSSLIKVIVPAVLRYWKIALFTAVLSAIVIHWRQYNSLKLEVTALQGQNTLFQALNKASAKNVEYMANINHICIDNKQMISQETEEAVEALEEQREEFGEIYAEAIEEIERLQKDDGGWLDADTVDILQALRSKANSN